MIEGERNFEINLQTLYISFKRHLVNKIHKYSKQQKPKILQEISALQGDCIKALNNIMLSKDIRCENAAIIDRKIHNLEKL